MAPGQAESPLTGGDGGRELPLFVWGTCAPVELPGWAGGRGGRGRQRRGCCWRVEMTNVSHWEPACRPAGSFVSAAVICIPTGWKMLLPTAPPSYPVPTPALALVTPGVAPKALKRLPGVLLKVGTSPESFWGKAKAVAAVVVLVYNFSTGEAGEGRVWSLRPIYIVSSRTA